MIKPIQTRYAGYLFRSRLEARWAVFFDAIGANWTYEPEGFQLPSGTYYLPDFRILTRNRTLWFEIKPGKDGSKSFEEFIGNCEFGTGGSVLNDIPDPRYVAENFHYYDDDRPHMRFADGNKDGSPGWDAPYQFCICRHCGEVGFEFEAHADRIGCGHETTHPGQHPKIIAAFTAARSARFEHGESGATRPVNRIPPLIIIISDINAGQKSVASLNIAQQVDKSP